MSTDSDRQEPDKTVAADPGDSATDSPRRDDASARADTRTTGRRLTLSLRWDLLALSVILAILLAGNVVFGWLWHQSQITQRSAVAEAAALRSDADSQHHAEQVALDYAKGAAQMDYRDIPGWTKRLTANTSPELTKKLQDAAASMEQIIVPLQWVSTPTPITATTRSQHDGVLVVNCFVSVMTKNTQAPDGIQSTATYTVTVDQNNNWVITDVGGVDSALRASK